MKTHSTHFKLYFQRLTVIYILSVLAIISIPQNITGQELIKRPTIGLALSGGGAHGIAHLGVIKVLEEAGLRPDYITGVSMGSIIGALYSIGYSADSMHKILKKINWKLLLSNKIPENKVIFIEKYNYDNSIISLPLLNKKVKLPMGLINGQQIENLLSFYTWPAADINDFSRLPIPFMCLGTDIISYTKVNLTTGYLADAIRASSSVPSIFTPIKIDTFLLVDGGLIRNFPAVEAKDMGSDILIGSYVGFKTPNEEELQSLPGIIKQIAFSKSREDFEEQRKLADVLINPKTGKIPITSFENADSLIQKGYEAALPLKEYFRKLADSLNQFGMQKPLENILDKQSYTFQKIEIKGNKSYSDFQVLGVLDIDSGEKIDKYMLTDKLELLYGKAWFEKVKYRIIPRNDSLILEIDCIEAPQAMLHGSIHYDNSVLAGLILGISAKNFITKGSVLNLKSYIAQFYKVDFNATQLIDRNQKLGLSANFYSDNTLIPMLNIKDETGDVISRNFSSGLSINQQLGLNQLMSLSVNYENTYLIPRYNSDINIKNLSYDYISGTYDYQGNTLDTKYFPDRGMIFNFSLGTTLLHSASIKTDSSKTVFRRDDTGGPPFKRFFMFKGHIKQYHTSIEKLTFSITGDVLLITKTDSLSAQNNFYLLGGLESVNKRSVSMIGFHPNEIPVKRLAVIMAELDYELFEKFHLNAIAGIAGAQEVNRKEGYSFITGYSIGVGYMSIIGPVRIGIMRGNYKREEYFKKTKGYISIGYNF